MADAPAAEQKGIGVNMESASQPRQVILMAAFPKSAPVLTIQSMSDAV
jgi:hypothetical protein